MDAWSALVEVLGDRRVCLRRLEEFDERIPGGDASDAGAIRITERYGGESEDVAKERQRIVDGAHGETEVRDRDGAGRGSRSGHCQRTSCGEASFNVIMRRTCRSVIEGASDGKGNRSDG